jgi:hypothetical protein
MGFSLGLQPLQAWIAILGLVLFSALCILAGAGSILRLVFPVGSFAVGVFLYRRYPILYIGFTWWMWFLTPLVRRLVDYQSGWDPQPLILLSPFLVTLITFVTFLQHLPRSYRQGGLPFILAFAAVFYSFLVGLIKTSPITAARASLDWLSPIFFGFHLFVNWRDYPSYRQNIQRTFLWGVLLTGVYGVVQNLVAPEWDRFWLIHSGMTSSAGSPEPFKIRVWSTMNSPGPFATVIMAGLLLLFNSQEALRVPAAIAGYLAFLLSAVRAAWGCWFVGLLTLLTSLKAHLQMRLIITILLIAVCVFPLTSMSQFSEGINSRVQSLGNLQKDNSAQDRAGIYRRNINLALSNGLGNGTGNLLIVKENGQLEPIVLDSGILDLFFTLGWFGAIPYLAGIFLLLFELFQGSESRLDTFVSTARAISLSLFLAIPFGTSTVSLSGIVFWGFSGMGMAARKYYQHQRLKRG